MQAGQRLSSVLQSFHGNQELQSSLVRFAAWLAMGMFVGVGGLVGHYEIEWSLYAWLFGVHFVWFAALFQHVWHQPELNRARTYVAIAADLSAITLLIYVSGALLAPFYLIYVLSFLSQGMRFGRRNLAVASAGSVLSYAAVATAMGGWQEHAFEVGFVLAALVVLPLYQNTLLRNLQEARHSAEVANRARGRFLATMTHELRTPLSGVVGMARLLERTRLDAEQRRYVDSICSSADTLQSLIGDILDLSKVDAGTLELQPGWFTLREQLAEVCHNLAPQALEKRVELVCCIDGRLPRWIHADRVRLQQILYNLLGNAVKFTETGHVYLEADHAPPGHGMDGQHLLIAIGDTGSGIPADRLDCIFDSFWQADPSTTRSHGGTGLGTTIAQRLVRAMNGEIEVESTEGEGTLFRVRLPLLAGDAERDAPPVPPAVLAGRRVVVSEPEPRSAAAIEEACRQAGMEVHCCTDDAVPAHPALQGADLLLVADSPAGRDLTGVAAGLRERLGQRCPVVFLHYRGRCLPRMVAGEAAVAKPLQPLELWEAMVRALTQVGSSDGETAAPAPEPAPAERERRILVAEDDPVNAQLIETLLLQAGHQPWVVNDGRSALEAVRAQAFDLLLLDLRMPGMDGAELAKRLRAGEAGDCRVPIVALSASAEEDSRARCLDSGMDAFLAKPVDPRDLDSLLAQWVAA